MVYVKIKVIGLVQGVGFRYFVYRNALKLGVTGWVQNSHSSRNEVFIELEGEEWQVEELIKQVKIGPTFSNVKNVIVEKLPYENKYKEFFIKE